MSTTDHTRSITTAAHPGELANRLLKMHDEAKAFSDPWTEVARSVWAVVEGKDAEIERLRGAATEIERLSDTYTVEGTEIVMQRIIDLRRERDEARAALAAERERIATAIEVEESETSEDSEALGLRTAARIARSTTDGTETVTYDGFGAPIVRDGGGTDG